MAVPGYTTTGALLYPHSTLPACSVCTPRYNERPLTLKGPNKSRHLQRRFSSTDFFSFIPSQEHLSPNLVHELAFLIDFFIAHSFKLATLFGSGHSFRFWTLKQSTLYHCCVVNLNRCTFFFFFFTPL